MKQVAISAAPTLQIADLTDLGGGPRVFDLRLAELLGYERPRDIRKIIRRNMVELEAHEQAPHDGAEFAGEEEDGISRHDGAKIPTFIDDGISRHGGAKLPARGRGRPEEGFLLNEAQAILITMFSRTPAAAEVRRQIIAVYIAWRHGRLGLPAQLPLYDPDRNQDRRTTPLERLLSEVARVAPKHGLTPESLINNLFSEGYRKQISNKSMNVENALHKGKSWRSCHAHGMDLRYVLTGMWDVTPQERRVAANMRAAQDAYRLEQPPPQFSITCEP